MLARLERTELSERPVGQLLVGQLGLRFDYAFPRRTEIVLEGYDKLPQDRGVFIAMNHTDRFNYWPLQWRMCQLGGRFTATWVKGKYFENPLLAWFLSSTNNIPLPSRGYLVATRLRRELGRDASPEEYRALRDRLDAGEADDLEGQFQALMREVARLNRSALHDKRLHLLVFPQGTRSRRLSRGHIGLAQFAQHLGAPIVPVGCSGSDLCYPGNSPFSKGGRIVYRFGEPLEVDGPELAPHRVREDFVPLSREAGQLHAQPFRAITDIVMERIDGLVDTQYRFADGEGGGEEGVGRFL
ncbi:MAG TPA: lysophospholipid acyltransferase family protein [Myxococcota bacterium]|nr:lysophospholipid acyltransferase family protein [Myxococcota bacterium]